MKRFHPESSIPLSKCCTRRTSFQSWLRGTCRWQNSQNTNRHRSAKTWIICCIRWFSYCITRIITTWNTQCTSASDFIRMTSFICYSRPASGEMRHTFCITQLPSTCWIWHSLNPVMQSPYWRAIPCWNRPTSCCMCRITCKKNGPNKDHWSCLLNSFNCWRTLIIESSKWRYSCIKFAKNCVRRGAAWARWLQCCISWEQCGATSWWWKMCNTMRP